MKKVLFVLFLLCSNLWLLAQPAGDFYRIDVQHSILTFKVRHVGFGSVVGKFSSYDATIYFDPNDLQATSASVVAEVSSIDTGAGGRDGILRNEFFEVQKHPLVRFSSTGVEQDGGNLLLLGELTIGAVTKSVKIPFEHLSGPAKDQFHHYRVAFSGSLEVNRRDFGLFYRSNEFWDKIIEDKVLIEIECGARVYNSLETVFPFRENSIGRLAFEAYEEGGSQEARKQIDEVFANKEGYIVNAGQMLRGAGHLAQSGLVKEAVEVIDIFLDRNPDFSDEMKAEFMARKSQYLLVQGKGNEATKVAFEAMKFYPNTLASEVLKVSQ